MTKKAKFVWPNFATSLTNADMTKEDVLRALSTVQEPDLQKDLVTLNMVRDISIDGAYISFTVVLTTPACPLKDQIKKACIQAIKEQYNEAIVKLNFTSSTTTIRADKSTVLPGVKKRHCRCQWQGRRG